MWYVGGPSISCLPLPVPDPDNLAKSEGMQIAVNWQDADSSSAKGVKGVKEIFKYYFIFIIHNGMWRSCREGTQTLGTVMRVSGIERGFTGDECVMFMKVHIAEKYENETFTKEQIHFS